MTTSYSTGFQPDRVSLSNMKEVTVKMVLIGDGMSGKTQILKTIGIKLVKYLQKIYSESRIEKLSDDISLEGADALLSGRSSGITPSFKGWAEKHGGFFLSYGRTKWDLTAVSLDTETIGLEDFLFVFPYVWNGQIYKIRLIGSDVGGQNIFDHFRAVLGKIAGPDDNMVVVFDKSRALSCYNSMQQIKSVVGEMTDRRWRQETKYPRIICCGNKTDLEKHIQAQSWCDSVLKSLMDKIIEIQNFGKGSYDLPSLVGETKKERTIKLKLKDTNITFPDFEALVYCSIKESDSAYGRMMSEVNTKALAREIAAQMVYNRSIIALRKDPAQLEQVWGNFSNLLFQRRPLAMQYSGGIEFFQHEESSDSFGRVRDKWGDFNISLPISETELNSAIKNAASASEILAEMGDFFHTNALIGDGVLEMIDSVIQKSLAKIGDPDYQKKRTVIKRKITKF